MGFPNSGLTISRYHEQKSSQISLYIVSNAADILNFEKSSLSTFRDSSILDWNQVAASEFSSGTGMEESTLQPFTNRNAFQILFAKFRPCSINFSSYNKSFPAGELKSIPARTASAPKFEMRSSGFGELPRDFDIFLPSL